MRSRHVRGGNIPLGGVFGAGSILAAAVLLRIMIDIFHDDLDNDGPRIWAIGGGKGGVGKSVLAANLGVVLAKRRQRVIVVDADLGGANLHTLFGMPDPELTLSDYIDRGSPASTTSF